MAMRVLAVLLATLGLAVASAAGPAHAASEPLPPQGSPPPGANDFACKPPTRHPYPVVLVHGTFGNMGVSWNAIAPVLERLGYCVFALDYGNSPLPGINATGDIPTSARQLSTFVGKVLAATGARKVSIVGHSQGGMMPRYYLKFLGGATRVDDLVGLSPSNHGTTTPGAAVAGPLCVACAQQAAGSPFLQALNAGDQTPGPVSYTVVETRYDEVVTPYESEFLPETSAHRVTNVLLQDRCPADVIDHVGIIYDPVAIQLMLNALGRPGPADRAYQPDCADRTLAGYPDSSSVAPAPRRAARLTLGRPRRAGPRTLRVPVSTNGQRVRGVVVTLRRPRGGRLARSRRSSVTRRRGVRLRLRRTLRPGRYLVAATGVDRSGRRVRAARGFRVR